LLALVAAPAAAAQGQGQPPDREPARIKLRLSGLDDGRVDVGERFKVVGKVFPFVPDQKVRVFLKRGEKFLQRRKMKIEQIEGRDAGRFELVSKRVIKPGTYRFRANKNQTVGQDGALAGSRGVNVDFPDLDPGDHGKKVRLFNKLLAKRAYHTSKGRDYDSATARAVLAFRKVNNMSRTTQANPAIYKKLAAGKGGFKLKWPEGGKHVEADLSRQVMVLARGGKARHIFHISSGTAATPTVRGKFPVYRFQPGYNSKSMYYSVYFTGGYATHGYASVPTYPASHGCLRNPIPDSVFIYNWLNYGDVFYVYG
jgi:L,D-transpeptidase catalytic domain